MTIDDPRIRLGWLAFTSSKPQDAAKVRAWRDAHPAFAPWTIDWFSVECAHDVVADDFDPVRGTGSALLFRTRAVAEKFGACEEVVVSGVRRIEPVYYADVSRARAPDVVRQQYAARLHNIGEALAAAVPGGGRLDVSGVFFAPATDAGSVALAAALVKFDEVATWAREQELRLVEEAEGARAAARTHLTTGGS